MFLATQVHQDIVAQVDIQVLAVIVVFLVIQVLQDILGHQAHQAIAVPLVIVEPQDILVLVVIVGLVGFQGTLE